jgi:chromate transporter
MKNPTYLSQTKHHLEIFLAFLRLGLTSFGGPIAHLGYFRQEFVAKRKWLNEHAFADLVSLCQFLPGPASSQVGIALGLSRGGIWGALLAWLGFTLPSAIALVLFAYSLSLFGPRLGTDWLHGLKLVAVAVVAQALWGMGKTLSPDKLRATFTVLAAALVTFIPHPLAQIGVIVLGGLFGWVFLPSPKKTTTGFIQSRINRTAGFILLALFFSLLFSLPIFAASFDTYWVKLFDCFYRTGSLVFGGGHVVLPLLQSQVVPQGWVSNNLFLAGYGATQAVPGPLFTFAAFLGAVSSKNPSGWLGAAIAIVAIFLPSFLLVIGITPFWVRLRRYSGMQRAMLGINSAVVGLLLAAFYNPVWTSAIQKPADFCVATIAFLSLVFWQVPPWLIVVLAGILAGLGVV